VQLIRINLADAPRKETPLAVLQNPGMGKRKALSKRTRFEIFKRDGFKCYYCGATPQNAAMEVSELVLDHVKPLKLGGETAAHNLVTSCVPCTAGKSAVPLSLRKYEPKAGEAEQEQAEQLRAFLEIQREVADLKEDHLTDLEEDWDRLTGLRQPLHLRSHLRNLSKEYTVDQLREAMEALSRARLSGPALPYFRGILKNLGKPYTPPAPKPAPAPQASPGTPLAIAARALVGAVIREMNETGEPKGFNARCARARAAFAYAAGGTPKDVDYFADPEWQRFNEDEVLYGLTLRVDAWADDSFQVYIGDMPGYDVRHEALRDLAQEVDYGLGHFFYVHDAKTDPDERRAFMEKWLEKTAREVADKEIEVRRLVDYYVAFGAAPKATGEGA
jgi:hypothetical protein